MATTAPDVLIDTIHKWGVNVVFGLPGDGINGIMEALRKRKDEIRFVQVRREVRRAGRTATPCASDCATRLRLLWWETASSCYTS
jgi:thiamine pyrophosphate-dependent acetolactate synthase large subunit-like protein